MSDKADVAPAQFVLIARHYKPQGIYPARRESPYAHVTS